jgi:hypothetical protein
MDPSRREENWSDPLGTLEKINRKFYQPALPLSNSTTIPFKVDRRVADRRLAKARRL